MFVWALAFLAGHCVIHTLPQLPDDRTELLAGGVAIGLVALCFVWRRFRSVGRVALAFACGLALALWQANLRLAERWPEPRSGTDVEMIGYIASIVDRDENGQRFRFDVVSMDEPPIESIEVRHLDLNWYDTQVKPQPGELWALRVRLRAPHGFANPGGYDYEAQLLRENIGATGYVRDAPVNRRLAAARGYWVLRARAAIAARLASALPNSALLGIVQGLAVGDTSRMTNEQWRVFASTGTTHLMAISGMHIGMVALWIGWLSGRCVRWLPLQRRRFTVAGIEACIGMSAAIVYSALAGFSVPTQRTLVMLCVFFAARLLRKEIPATRGLAIALIGVLLADPFAPLASGFWLSFGAVAAIFLATGGYVAKASRLREYGRMQIVATIGLLPLAMSLFGSFSLISPLVNLVAIPFFTLLIVPLVLIATALLFVNEMLGSAAVQGIGFLLERTWPALEKVSTLPMAMWWFPAAPLWAFVLLFVGTFVVLVPGVLATRLAGALLCLPALCWRPVLPRSGEFNLSLLDVGQGLSVVVTTTSHVLVYDTGPSFRSGRDTGELVVVPYLHALGVRRIDALIVSHGDSDHVGGMKGVVDRIPIDRFLLGPSVKPRPESEVCAAGQSWVWDGVRFQVLYPSAELFKATRNNSSCVLRVDGIGGSLLLFGDIERGAEEWLIERNAIARADIAVVPHHGSRTSSTTGLVAATSPAYALISAGYLNQWGFPKADVLARWEESGAVTLKTSDSGAIEIAVTQRGVAPPREYRRKQPRYWRK